MTQVAPQFVRCPCGTGDAERTADVVTEVYRHDKRKRVAYYNYRHSGCNVGGTIVAIGEDVLRRLGPLFHPGRYRVGLEAEEMAQQPLLADGGDVTTGDQYLCHMCGELRRGLGAALLCCSDDAGGDD